jgi:hypothetical protein
MYDAAMTSQILHSLLHISEAIAEGADILFIKAGTIIVDIDIQFMIGNESNAHLRRLCMLYHIVQCFLYR